MAEEEERKVALITGITGQDGSYLAELLLEKGYTVSGVQGVGHISVEPSHQLRTEIRTIASSYLVYLLAFLFSGARHCAEILLLQHGSH